MLRELGAASNGEVGCSGNKELRVAGLAGKWDARGTGEMRVSRGSGRWDARRIGAVGAGGSGEMGRSGKRVPWSREERSRVSGEPRELRCRSAVRPKGYPVPGVPGCPESRLTGQPELGAGRSPLRDARRSSRGSQGAVGAAAPRRGQLRVSAAGRCRPARTPPDPPGERRSRPAPPPVLLGGGS